MDSRKRIRKIFSPLSIVSDVQINISPFQIYNADTGKYTPDYFSEKDLIITPRFFLRTAPGDSSWTLNDTNIAERVENFNWYANGVLLREEKDDPLGGSKVYSINRVPGPGNGSLVISRNLSGFVDLVYKGVFVDPRNNNVIELQSEIVRVGVTEDSSDEWDFSFVCDSAIEYHPLLDRLREYDYRNSLTDPSTPGYFTSDAERTNAYNKAMDGNQYLRSIPFVISHGKGVINSTNPNWSKCRIRCYVSVRSVWAEAIAGETLFLRELDNDHVLLDLRFIPNGTVFRFDFLYDGVVRSSEYRTFLSVIDRYSCESLNESSFDLSTPIRHDKAYVMVESCGRHLPNPEAYLSITWLVSTTVSPNETVIGSGSQCTFDLSRINIGTGTDCYFDIILRSFVKSSVATLSYDADKRVILIDANNQPLTHETLHQ